MVDFTSEFSAQKGQRRSQPFTPSREQVQSHSGHLLHWRLNRFSENFLYLPHGLFKESENI
jgi:hypothetical protein